MKAIKKVQLTGFFYTIIEQTRRISGRKRVAKNPYGFMPENLLC